MTRQKQQPSLSEPTVALTTSRKPRWLVLAGAALIAVAIGIVYFPALRGGFIFDDDLYLTDASYIHASNGLYRIWCTSEAEDYYPLSNTTLWLEWRLWGMNPEGYRVTNLLLHIVACLLIWLLLARLAIPGAFLAALLFAVHPVNVETVAWIAQRKELVATLFLGLSILWYLQSDEEAPSASTPSAGFDMRYCLSVLAFVLAMLSKGSVAILPVLLLLIVWWKRKRIDRRDLVRCAPFFVIAAVMTPIIVWFVTHGGHVRNVTMLDRILGAGASIWFYLSKAALPINLLLAYPRWDLRAENMLWWLPLLAAGAVTLVLWRHWPLANWARSLLFVWMFFCVALVPVMGFADTGYMQHTLVANHYQHLALIAVLALAAAGAVRQLNVPASLWGTGIIVALLGVMSLLTWKEARLYESPIALYEAALDGNPNSGLAHNNLAIELAKVGRLDEANRHYQQVLRFLPNSAEVENNIGFELANSGRLEAAIQHYRVALEVRPNYYVARNNLGAALVRQGNLQEGIDQYEKALQDRPEYADARNNLGIALSSQGKIQEAITQFTEATRLDPALAEAHYNLGSALSTLGQNQKAIEEYQLALALRPDYCDAHINLAIVLASEGRLQDAIDHYQRAVQSNPESLNAQNNLGNTLARLGRPEEALAHLEAAVRLKPESATIHNNLGATLADLRRFQQAIDHYQQAIRLDAQYTQAYLNLAKASAELNRSAEAIAAAERALALAQSNQRTALVQQIETWLKKYRASLSSNSKGTAHPELAPSAP